MSRACGNVAYGRRFWGRTLHVCGRPEGHAGMHICVLGCGTWRNDRPTTEGEPDA